MTFYPPTSKTSEIPPACKRRLNNLERAERAQQLWRVCTPSSEPMPPRYAGDDQPDITYGQAHGLME